MNGTVYVLEDDSSIGGLVKVSLSMSEIDAQVFGTIKQFNDAITQNVPDVALLDIMLPDGNGLEVLRSIKKDFPNVSCLIMSALGQETDKINGLELGADDYIAKPFSVMELVARVKAALRRQVGNSVLRSGNVEMNADTMEVTLNGEPVVLNKKEFELLRYLIKNQGKVLPREIILNEVWGYGYTETRTLDNHIARLRKSGFNGIDTIFGVGYRYLSGEKK